MNAPPEPLRAAFCCQPATGHVNPLLSIALRLREQRHQARFFMPGIDIPRIPFLPEIVRSASEVAESITARGFPLTRLPMPLSAAWTALRLVRSRGYAELERAVKLFTAGLERQTRALVEHFRREPPDVVVTDFALFSAAAAAGKLGIPYACVYHCGLPFRGAGVPPFGSGLPIGSVPGAKWRDFERREAALAGGLDAALSGLGMVAGDALRTPYSPWLNLVLSDPAVEAPREVTPATFFVGPCFSARARGADDIGDGFPFDALRPDAFKVYVSLGTVFNVRPALFRAIIDGLAGDGVQVVVSAGASLAALRRRPPAEGVWLFRRVPQLALLPRVDLVVSHGGNNTINETLAAGKPLLVVPIGGEQGDNARRIEYLGAGLSLALDAVTPDRVAERVRALRSSGCAGAAARIGETLRDVDGARAAAALIERLARARRPLDDRFRTNRTEETRA